MAFGGKRLFCLSPHRRRRCVIRVHAEFDARARCDQLRVLSTEIENENPVRVNIGHQPIR